MNRYIPLLPEDCDPAATYHPADLPSVNSIRLHYLDYGGEGPPLLLLPGLTANARMFDAVAAAGLIATSSADCS
jgi:hypothetical protein